MSKETQTMVPENAEPVYQLWSDEGFGGWTDTDKSTYCWWLDSKNPPRMRKLYTAPVAAQAQPTWDDLRALAVKHGAWVPGYGPFAAELLATYGLAPAAQPHWVAGWLTAANAVKAQAQPITAADAVYGLLAWLSGRDEVVTLSARHGAAIAADLAKAFCEENGLQQFSQDYPDNLKYPKSALEQQPVSGADQFRDSAQMIEPSGNAGDLQDQGDSWSGWACQYPGKLPRLYGAKEIAVANHHPEEGDRLIFLSSQQDADKVDAERYQAWRDALITGKTAEDDFIRLVADSLPTSVGVSRRPTAAEWDAAIDAARKENSNA